MNYWDSITNYFLKKEKYKYVVVGAGTGGCITAYVLASKMQEYNIPGKVLLLDSGDAYYPSKTTFFSRMKKIIKAYHSPSKSTLYPHPKMWHWFTNWSKLSHAHETIGIGYLPVPASSHIGVGGGGAHDTR